jgi:hypothetical protein
MGMRRSTRLTNGFSKKVDNHRHMIALYFLYYNFGPANIARDSGNGGGDCWPRLEH